MAKPARRKRKSTLADKADRHDLYQRSVQCVEAEIDFVDETFKHLRGRSARILREDFCGTANTSCEWVRRRKRNVAMGVDLDAEVLDWGRRHNLAALGVNAKRVQLYQDDVTRVQTPPADALLAMNFSYWIFKTRRQLKHYFRQVLQALSQDGIFFLDAYGGYDAYRVTRDRHVYDGFTYFWDQAAFNPITGDMTCYIHFRFPDGSRLKQAFSYHWRLWSLPEIQELLSEAGFRRVTVYWQGTEADTGEADGDFKPALVADADPAWIAYITAER